jgi:hypothetical protein
MKTKQITIVALVLVAAILVAYAAEEEVLFSTKEDMKQTKYLDPSTTEMNLSLEDAKSILTSLTSAENPEVTIESINGELIDEDGFGLIWQLSARTTDGDSIFTGINASTGELVFGFDGSKNEQVSGNVNINEDEALEIAEKYVESKLSAEKINDLQFNRIRYQEPHGDGLASYYDIRYNRIIRGIATFSDRVSLDVNAETGEVSSYYKKWSMSEDEIALIDTKPGITAEEATEIIKEFMRNEPYIGEEKADTVVVKSSTLVWKEDDDDKAHLVWQIQFMDSSFAEDDNYPASACIDAHSGKMLLFDYARD